MKLSEPVRKYETKVRMKQLKLFNTHTSPPLAIELAASGLFGDIGLLLKLFRKLGEESPDPKL